MLEEVGLGGGRCAAASAFSKAAMMGTSWGQAVVSYLGYYALWRVSAPASASLSASAAEEAVA